MELPDFSSLYDWLRSAEQMANARRRYKPQPACSLSEVLAEPHRFAVVVMHHPEDLIVEPPFLIDLALDEAIEFRRTRGMGAARLNKLSWHGMKFLEARTKRSRSLLERLARSRRLTGNIIA